MVKTPGTSWTYKRGEDTEATDIRPHRRATHRRRPARPRVFQVLGIVGRVFITFGVIVLLFTAYLLWGTGLLEQSHQNALRQQFERELAHVPHSSRSAISPSGSPATTSPSTKGVQPVVPGAVPGEGQPVGIIQIPKIGLDKVVVEGDGTDDLQLGPGHYPGTPLPGQPGNSAIAGHRTTYGAPFYNLNELSAGDPIYVTTTQGRFEYQVTQQLVVGPSDTSVVGPTATPKLTLTTCNPRFSDSSRLVVQAELVTPPASVPNSSQAARTLPKSTQLAGAQGSPGGAIVWGIAFLLLGIVVLVLGRRYGHRWLTYGLGVIVLLVVLFFFFENVSPLLPASF